MVDGSVRSLRHEAVSALEGVAASLTGKAGLSKAAQLEALSTAQASVLAAAAALGQAVGIVAARPEAAAPAAVEEAPAPSVADLRHAAVAALKGEPGLSPEEQAERLDNAISALEQAREIVEERLDEDSLV